MGGIEHGFTVFQGCAYNEWADERSWKSMSSFLKKALGDVPFDAKIPENENVETVEYSDVDGALLKGYLALPENKLTSQVPGVIILPDWDGVNRYEKLRATLLADSGYIAFAADIYGQDLQEGLSFETRIE